MFGKSEKDWVFKSMKKKTTTEKKKFGGETD